MTDIRTKSFQQDLRFIFNKIKNKKHFAFSKYADGEFKILKNEAITNCDNWTFCPNSHKEERGLLYESFLYNHEDYIVGVSCPCCQPISDVKWMRSKVKADNITWANLLVNGNYDFFKSNFFPEFDNWNGKVTLVANQIGLYKKMPFKVDSFIPIKIGSWQKPEVFDIIKKLKTQAIEQDDQLFLFSGGPLGNILAHQLHLVNQNNTYLDIGSTINPWIVGENRGYLNNNQNKICIW
tara:strand:- start:1075 stop:1785 length:711 start_codon:yes stop_codon:yes gene_type:complete